MPYQYQLFYSLYRMFLALLRIWNEFSRQEEPYRVHFASGSAIHRYWPHTLPIPWQIEHHLCTPAILHYRKPPNLDESYYPSTSAAYYIRTAHLLSHPPYEQITRAKRASLAETTGVPSVGWYSQTAAEQCWPYLPRMTSFAHAVVSGVSFSPSSCQMPG